MDIPILIQKKTAGAKKYGVTVPDIPGCVTTGETVDRAMSNATKAIYGHLGQLIEQGKAFELKASEVENLAQEPDYAGGIWALVSLDLARLDDPPED
jgi:predicted RNase H-like HicB family nuclease